MRRRRKNKWILYLAGALLIIGYLLGKFIPIDFSKPTPGLASRVETLEKLCTLLKTEIAFTQSENDKLLGAMQSMTDALVARGLFMKQDRHDALMYADDTHHPNGLGPVGKPKKPSKSSSVSKK
jgi:hypothetical protein